MGSDLYILVDFFGFASDLSDLEVLREVTDRGAGVQRELNMSCLGYERGRRVMDYDDAKRDVNFFYEPREGTRDFLSRACRGVRLSASSPPSFHPSSVILSCQ